MLLFVVIIIIHFFNTFFIIIIIIFISVSIFKYTQQQMVSSSLIGQSLSKYFMAIYRVQVLIEWSRYCMAGLGIVWLV